MPTVVLSTAAFTSLAVAVAAGEGAPELAISEFPHPLNDEAEDFIRQATRDRIQAIVEHLVVDSNA